MGCEQSKKKKSDGDAEDAEKDAEKRNLENGNPLTPLLTDQQKALICNTWKLLVENIAQIGVITFMSLFETHPDVQQVFMPFQELTTDELRYSKELRAHALRVMGFVQKVVARLEEPDKIEQLLRELGKKHVLYGAKEQYVDYIGPQFIYAIKPSLEDHWTYEIEEAWLHLFQMISYIMKNAMEECRQTTEPTS